jgi:hypothetical protein
MHALAVGCLASLIGFVVGAFANHFAYYAMLRRRSSRDRTGQSGTAPESGIAWPLLFLRAEPWVAALGSYLLIRYLRAPGNAQYVTAGVVGAIAGVLYVTVVVAYVRHRKAKRTSPSSATKRKLPDAVP